MSLDGIAAVRSRIGEIQRRFAPAAVPAQAVAPGPASDFATLLARAGSAPAVVRTVATGARTQAFLDEALRQAGDPYVWGAHAPASDPDPAAFDCSELTRWAAARVGVDLPDGSWLQYLKLKEQGALVPVDQALRTPGALLFSFSEEPRPGGGRPAEAHVAISLGDGSTIEARSRRHGVGVFEAGNRFAYAAVVPGFG